MEINSGIIAFMCLLSAMTPSFSGLVFIISSHTFIMTSCTFIMSSLCLIM